MKPHPRKSPAGTAGASSAMRESTTSPAQTRERVGHVPAGTRTRSELTEVGQANAERRRRGAGGRRAEADHLHVTLAAVAAVGEVGVEPAGVAHELRHARRAARAGAPACARATSRRPGPDSPKKWSVRAQAPRSGRGCAPARPGCGRAAAGVGPPPARPHAPACKALHDGAYPGASAAAPTSFSKRSICASTSARTSPASARAAARPGSRTKRAAGVHQRAAAGRAAGRA